MCTLQNQRLIRDSIQHSERLTWRRYCWRLSTVSSILGIGTQSRFAVGWSPFEINMIAPSLLMNIIVPEIRAWRVKAEDNYDATQWYDAHWNSWDCKWRAAMEGSWIHLSSWRVLPVDPACPLDNKTHTSILLQRICSHPSQGPEYKLAHHKIDEMKKELRLRMQHVDWRKH